MSKVPTDVAPAILPKDPETRRHRSPRQRRMMSLGVGVVLAAVLAAVLVSGLHSSSTATSAGNVTDTAPGINAQSASLLNLDVISANQALPAANFQLVDQNSRPTSLSQFRGKVVIWSLNDDQCTDLCALFAQDVAAANQDLGAAAKDVVFLSVNANPFYPSVSSVKAWTVQNDLQSQPNWVYVTGTPAQLESTWKQYDVTVIQDPKTRTVVHDAAVDFITPAGRTQALGYFDQGSLSTAYFAHTMAQMADDLLPRNEQVRVGGTAVNATATKGASIGDQAPAFSLNSLGASDKVGLDQIDTKPLVLNFWSSTCSICVQEMPALQKVYADFGGKVDVLGIDVADLRSSAASFARRLGVRYSLLADTSGNAAAEYRVDALPVTFVIAPGGSIVARHDGALTTPELEAVLDMQFQDLPQISN